MIRRTLLIAALVLTSSGFARAATLMTSPFPGTDIASGTATCSISNDGTKTARVTVEILDRHGSPSGINAFQTFDIGVGITESLPGVDLTIFNPVRCRFTVPSKGKVRGAFVWTNGNSQTPVIIPAQ